MYDGQVLVRSGGSHIQEEPMHGRPGNQLLSVNARKLTVVYWTIGDFGSRALQNEEAWFELMVIKSTTVKRIDGGFAGLAVAATKCFYNEDHDSELAGYHLKLFDGTTIQIYLRIRISMHDEAALHAWFGCKGSSGIRCCLKHK